MADPMSMDDILNDKPAPRPEPAAPEPQTEPAALKDPVAHQQAQSNKDRWRDREQEAQGRVRDPETGQYVAKPKEEPAPEAKAPPEAPKAAEAAAPPAAAPEAPKPEVTPPVQDMTPREKAAFAKAADETRKRQALEARVRDMEARAATAAPVAPQEPPKTFWDDPEAAMRQQQQFVQQTVLQTKLQTAEAIARSRHEDYDEKVSIFSELAQSTPGLAQQMLAAPDPAEFAYRTAKSHKELQEVGGIDAMRQKIQTETEARVRAQIEGELRAKAAELEKQRAALPGSLSNAPSRGTNRPVWNGPTSMDDILKS